MKLTQLHPTRFLSAKELQGKSVAITIERIVAEDARDAETGEIKRLHVIYARGKERGIVITKTIMRELVTLFGDVDTSALIGKRLNLWPGPTRNKREQMLHVKAAGEPEPAPVQRPAEQADAQVVAAALGEVADAGHAATGQGGQ